MMNVSVEAAAVWEKPPQDVQVMNDPIGDPGQKRPALAPRNSLRCSVPAGADSLYRFSSSHSAISIADLLHAGAESLLGVSIFNYLTPPISATLSPLEGRRCTAGQKQQNAN